MSWVAAEPLRTTLVRTVGLAVIIGGVIAWRLHSLEAWVIGALLALWFTFGGHWVEVWFLYWLRPRLPSGRPLQVLLRLVAWFVGGAGLGVGIALTSQAFALTRSRAPPPWWVAGLAFIALELVVHAALQARGRPSFYDGRG